MSEEQGVASLLRSLFEAAGEAWPAPIEHHPSLGSTSDRLKAWAREGAPDLAVVIADAQDAGRGRQGRTWVSPAGNLHLSVLLHPEIGQGGLVPLLGGVAVCAALESLGVPARLKWPNDVLAGALSASGGAGRAQDGSRLSDASGDAASREAKLAGILAEASSGPRGIEWVVLGIGVNVDPRGALPEGATSLRGETGRAVPPAAVAAAVLGQVRVWYHALASGRAQDLLAAWRGRSVPWWGRLVEARSGDQVIRGIATDIDDEGALLLTLPEGQTRVTSGEVSRVRLAPARPLPDPEEA